MNPKLFRLLFISTKGSKTKLTKACRHLSIIVGIPNDLNPPLLFLI